MAVLLPRVVQADDRRGYLRDSTQHHRRAGARPAEELNMIDLQPNEDQQLVVDATLAFLAQELSVGRLNPKEKRADAESKAWPRMAELGWFGILVPEAQGGMGFGSADAALLFREFGRYVLSPSVLATVAAARIASLGGRTAIAEALIAGTRKA